jgi:predicted amidohydrolase
MRLALAPINPTVGDIAGNAALITRWIERAREDHADFVAFPELALTGYPPKDLLLQEGFMAAVTAAAKQFGERHTEGITVVFGTPLPLKGQDGGPTSASDEWGLANSLLAYRDGRMLGYYDKRLLPTYDVFDEDRYFEPGSRPVVIEAAGARIGLSICEDLWRGEDVGFSHKYLDCADPVAELVEPPGVGRAGGAQLIINPSASPFVLGKGRRHRELLRRHAMRHGVWVAAVNQLGGNDELIFDGSAVVIAPDGSVVGANDPFREGLLIVEAPVPRDGGAEGGAGLRLAPDPFLELSEEELAYRALVLGVRDYLRKTGFSAAVIGLSGGIDSAVTAVIASMVKGPTVKGLPTHIWTIRTSSTMSSAARLALSMAAVKAVQ